MALRPINSVKNIFDATFITVAGGTSTVLDVSTCVNNYTGSVADVPIGSKINSIYFFVQIGQDSVNSNVDFYIIQNPANELTLPIPGGTGGHRERRFILHEEKGLPGNYNSGQSPLTFKGVIKIPKGRQRQGEDDKIQIVLRGAAAYTGCVKAIYKFYQ